MTDQSHTRLLKQLYAIRYQLAACKNNALRGRLKYQERQLMVKLGLVQG